MQTPETRYAERRDGVAIAYQVLGDGPLNLVFCFGWVSHLDLQWTNPAITRFFRRLASFSRLVLYDKAGTGLSDPVAHPSTLEERAQEIGAVMDAAGIERAALFGESEGGPSATLFAATCPDRVSSLVLYGAFARMHVQRGDELDELGFTPEVAQGKRAAFERVLDRWGQGGSIDLLGPSLADSRATRAAWALFERASVSPRMARALIDAVLDLDVTAAAKSVSAPTLVLHRRDDWVPLACGRHLARIIPGARLIELEGTDHAYFSQDADTILDETERFLTGTAGGGEPERVLATVLFTDIVDSTARAAAMGDGRWRELLEAHDALVHEHVERAGGRVVKSTGDGAFACFSGPARAIRCAEELVAAAADVGLQLRAGLHAGECEAIGDDLGGLTVHIGARVSGLARGGEVLVSSTVKDLVVGSGLAFVERGTYELKGVPGSWQIYALAGTSPLGPDAGSPADQLTATDRTTLRMARRAPGLLRAVGRITMRDRPRA